MRGISSRRYYGRYAIRTRSNRIKKQRNTINIPTFRLIIYVVRWIIIIAFPPKSSYILSSHFNVFVPHIVFIQVWMHSTIGFRSIQYNHLLTRASYVSGPFPMKQRLNKQVIFNTGRKRWIKKKSTVKICHIHILWQYEATVPCGGLW